MRRRFGPCVLTRDAEHRCHRVIAERDQRALVLSARAWDVHVAVNDLVRGVCGNQGAYLGALGEEPATCGRLRKGGGMTSTIAATIKARQLVPD